MGRVEADWKMVGLEKEKGLLEEIQAGLSLYGREVFCCLKGRHGGMFSLTPNQL